MKMDIYFYAKSTVSTGLQDSYNLAKPNRLHGIFMLILKHRWNGKLIAHV